MITQVSPTLPGRISPSRWVKGDVLASLGLLFITLSFWLPFGFSIPFWADGWPSMLAADQGIVIVNSARPFTYVPNVLARLLSPNIFVGLNILLATVMFGKGLFLYLILKRLFHDKPLAFAAAALLLAFPADTAVFNDGTLNIHFALFAFVGAVYFLVAYWQERRWYALVLMWLGLVITCGTYEAVYPLVLFTPLLILWQERRVTRRMVIVALLWYGVPLIAVGRLLILARNSQDAFGYQGGLYRGFTPEDIVPSFLRVYKLHFIDGWTRYSGFSYPYMGVAVIILSGVILWGLSQQRGRVSAKTLLLVTLGGLSIIALGYAFYYPTALREVTDRTFFYSSIGGAVTLAALLTMIAQVFPSPRFMYTGLVTGLIGLGMFQLLLQHQQYSTLGTAQLPLLRSVVTQAPLIQADTMIVVLDDTQSHEFGRIFVSYSAYFEDSLQVITQNPGLSAVVCYPHDPVVWGTQHEQCRFEPDRVAVTINDGVPFREQVYSRIVAFRYHTDGTLTLETNLSPDVPDAAGYDPYKLIDQSAPLPPRAVIMLGESGEN